MNFATWSIRNPIPAILLFVLLSLAGVWGFQNLPTQNLPDFDMPMVSVNLSQPGAAPAQMETEVARKVEDALATLSGLNHLHTSVTIDDPEWLWGVFERQTVAERIIDRAKFEEMLRAKRG